MAAIKPKIEKLVRVPNPDNISGFEALLSYALLSEATNLPKAPAFTNTLTGEAYVTAEAYTGPALMFGATGIFGKIETKSSANAVKLNTKPSGNYRDSNAVTSTVTAEVDCTPEIKGWIRKMKGQSLILILHKKGQNICLGTENTPCVLINSDDSDEEEKSLITLTFEYRPYEPLYLPAGTVIPYVP